MKKRFGFTLAEVLITLGIIGVVAAMTIPTLIQNTNSVKFESQFKKSISTLSQAALMSQAQYDVDFSLVDPIGEGADCSTVNVASGSNTLCGVLNGTLAGYAHLGKFGTAKGADGTNAYTYTKAQNDFFPTNKYELIQLADGSVVGYNTEASRCALQVGNKIADAVGSSGSLASCLGFIDVNGVTSPNREVECATANTTALTPETPCQLGTTGASIGDVYPIVFHDGTAEPLTNAARAVLAKGRKNSSTAVSQ